MVQGRSRLWDVRPSGLAVPKTAERKNQLQYFWGMIAAQTIGRGQASYKIAAMYIEFENVASPGNPVTIPTFGREEGTDYYDGIQSSGVRDFLRVAMLQDPLLGIKAGYESYFGTGEGNEITFYAQTTGTQGVHGKTFSDGVNSKVFGAALVATPDFEDRTQDIVFARIYYTVAQQTLKGASSQVGVTWTVAFL
jgi:hypothetical protein